MTREENNYSKVWIAVAVGAAIGVAYMASRRRGTWPKVRRFGRELVDDREDLIDSGREIIERIGTIYEEARKIVDEAGELWMHGRKVIRRAA